MPDSNKVNKFRIGLVVVWLVFTVAAFAYFIGERVVGFDENGKLADISHQKMGDVISSLIKGHNSDLQNQSASFNPIKLAQSSNHHTIVHISSSGCACQQYSEQHIKEINAIAQKHSVEVKYITLDKHQVIPATPSIAILDNQDDIVYFGPYGQGLYCAQTSGYAQTVLNNFVKGYVANLIVRQAKGCYCQLPFSS